MDDVIKFIDIERISTCPYQPRRVFEKEELMGLAASIQEIGLIQPPIVKEISDQKFELIAGERRLLALKLLGKKEIPVLVRGANPFVSETSSLVENIQRVDLNPLEIAFALKAMMQNQALTQDMLADKVGKKRSTVANYLRLLQLPLEIQEQIHAGKITMGHAKAILSLPPALQKSFCSLIMKENLSVRQAESKAQGLLKNKRIEKKGDIYLSELERRFMEIFGTKVQITKNKIVIDYYNIDDLERIQGIVHG